MRQKLRNEKVSARTILDCRRELAVSIDKMQEELNLHRAQTVAEVSEQERMDDISVTNSWSAEDFEAFFGEL